MCRALSNTPQWSTSLLKTYSTVNQHVPHFLYDLSGRLSFSFSRSCVNYESEMCIGVTLTMYSMSYCASMSAGP